MTRSKRGLRALLCIILCSMMFSGIYTGSAEAKEDTSWLKKEKGVSPSKKEVLYTDPSLKQMYNEWTVCLYPLSKNISAKKIKNVKSSNAKVLKIAGKPYNEKVGKKKAVVLDLCALKPGKATLSFKYKSKTYKIKFVVKRFNNGLQSFKLGGISKNFASNFNSGMMYDYDKEIVKNPANLQVKTKKNWVITAISVYTDFDMDGEKVFSNSKGKTSAAVKGSKLKFSDILTIVTDCKNKKTGEEEEYWLTLFKTTDVDL